MNELPSSFWPIFFEVFESLPRQGPGNHACAARALGLCRDLPPTPAVLDLGCGIGGQTLHLTELTSGTIVAIDSHAPSIERLRTTVAERGLRHRVWPVVGDMAHPGLAPNSFDVVLAAGVLESPGSMVQDGYRCEAEGGSCSGLLFLPLGRGCFRQH